MKAPMITTAACKRSRRFVGNSAEFCRAVKRAAHRNERRLNRQALALLAEEYEPIEIRLDEQTFS